MYGYIQAVVDEHRAYQEQPHNILYFKRENSDDPLEYLNTTFSIRTLYSGDSFVVDFKDKMYSIMNNHGQIILSEVIFNEGHGSGNFPAYDVVNELGRFGDIVMALEYLDDDMREFFYDMIPKAFKHLSYWSPDRRFVSGDKLKIQLTHHYSDWYKFEIKTNLKLWEKKDEMGLMMCDCKVERFVHRPEGLSLIVNAYELGEEFKKRFTYPNTPKRYTNQCDIQECNHEPDRGLELCPEHLKQFDSGVALPTWERGDEGEDITAYLSKFVDCTKCEKEINAHVRKHWVKDYLAMCLPCQEITQFCNTKDCTGEVIVINGDEKFCNDCVLEHQEEDYKSQ